MLPPVQERLIHDEKTESISKTGWIDCSSFTLISSSRPMRESAEVKTYNATQTAQRATGFPHTRT